MKYDFSKLDKRTIAKGLACKSIDELKVYLKTNNIDMPEEQIEKLFGAMNFSMQALSDDALEKVAGGYTPEEVESFKQRMRNGDKEAENELYIWHHDAWAEVRSELNK